LKYKDFSNEFLVAAYQESQLRSGETIPSGEIIDRYPLVFQPGWVVQLVRDLGVRGYLTSKGVNSDDRRQPIRLTGRGLRVAEDLIEKGVGIFRLDLGDGIGFPAARDDAPSSFNEDIIETAPDDEPSVVSSAWTGRILNAQQVEELGRDLDDALRRVDSLDLDNHKKAQCRAFIRAAQELASAPEPPFSLIAYLIANVDRIVGIGGFIVGVASLLVSLGV
jgi:DNA-binding MarR family transcriptional regulator